MPMPPSTSSRAAGRPCQSAPASVLAVPEGTRAHGMQPRRPERVGHEFHHHPPPRKASHTCSVRQIGEPTANGARGLGGLLRRGLALPVRYVRAAPLPHAVGGFAALIGAGLVRMAVEAAAEEVVAMGLPVLLPASGWFGLALLCGADGVSRYRDYLRMRRMLSRWGFAPRLLRPLASSRCQRDAAMQAAREAGCGDKAGRYYRELGYRWYHLLPDRVAANPLAFLDLRFLRATFLPGKR